MRRERERKREREKRKKTEEEAVVLAAWLSIRGWPIATGAGN